MSVPPASDSIESRFVESVLSQRFPARGEEFTLDESGCGPDDLLDLFETQLISRQLDLAARRWRQQGEAFYTIGSSGHEGVAVFARLLRGTDPALLHYRDAAFQIQRSKQSIGSTTVWDLVLSFVASAEDPMSGGRHKVLGAKSLNIIPQTSTIASHLPKAVGLAVAIDRAEALNLPGNYPEGSLVYCSFGDASVNHATALAALNAARWTACQRTPVPLLFVCEDNGLGISVRTPTDWIRSQFAYDREWMYVACDGCDLLDTYRAANRAIQVVRSERRPVFVHMKTVRLMGHAGSDQPTQYLSPAFLAEHDANDPLLYTARHVLRSQLLNPPSIVDWYYEIGERVERVFREATQRPKLSNLGDPVRKRSTSETATLGGSVPSADAASSGEGQALLISDDERARRRLPQPMAQLLNWTLADLMRQHPQLLVFGEDVAQKGGVFGVTAGLARRFGFRRVFNTLLDETSILGGAIGASLQGFLPIPEIQFLAYLHCAEDQLRGEAATLPYLSAGQYQCPMVIRIASFATPDGAGGPFHNENSLAVLRDIPGLIVACPSDGEEAARLLRSCVALALEQRRVVVFLEPIALYRQRDFLRQGDQGWCRKYPEFHTSIPLGEVACHGAGNELAFVTYGNGVRLCGQVQHELAERDGRQCRVIDLRWLSPLPETALLNALGSCDKVLVVDECRASGSLSEGVCTLLLEKDRGNRLVRRVTADDCLVPLGRAAGLVTLQRDSILAMAREML